MTDMYADVAAFHAKFDLPREGAAEPSLLGPEALFFRFGFLMEETFELVKAHVAPELQGAFDEWSKRLRGAAIEGARTYRLREDGGPPSMLDAVDAVADLVYVALGTGHMMGAPMRQVWDEVQRKNMMKERATGADDPRGKRGSALDVVKPAGWTPPDHLPAIHAAVTHHFNWHDVYVHLPPGWRLEGMESLGVATHPLLDGHMVCVADAGEWHHLEYGRTGSATVEHGSGRELEGLRPYLERVTVAAVQGRVP